MTVSEPRADWLGLPFELSARQEIACAARLLTRIPDLTLNVAGHISILADETDGDMLCTPWGMWWEEICASDVCLVSDEGQILEGKWAVSPAVFIHTELHKYRPDAKVIVHNHSHFATVFSTLHRLPKIIDQQGALFHDEMVLFDEYRGQIDSMDEGARLAAAVGDASIAVLANHGLISMASDIEEAVYKFAEFERTCRLNYEALSMGIEPNPLPDNMADSIKKPLTEISSRLFWEGAVRQLLHDSPDVLS